MFAEVLKAPAPSVFAAGLMASALAVFADGLMAPAPSVFAEVLSCFKRNVGEGFCCRLGLRGFRGGQGLIGPEDGAGVARAEIFGSQVIFESQGVIALPLAAFFGFNALEG